MDLGRYGRSGISSHYSQGQPQQYNGRSQLMNYPAFRISNRKHSNSSSRYDKDNPNGNTARELFRSMSNESLSHAWDANYKVATIGDLFLDFIYDRPGQWLLP
jgi:hypothetical protein